jgi:hypothetical protein
VDGSGGVRADLPCRSGDLCRGRIAGSARLRTILQSGVARHAAAAGDRVWPVVAFTAAQIWNDNERAEAAVNREAGALRTAIVLSAEFAAEPGDRLRRLIRQHIRETVDEEWPMMVHQSATLRFTPHFLPDALQLTLGLTPDSDGQRVAQREITAAIGNALDARLQRIIISRSQVNPVKWACLILQAVCALVAIAMVHSDDRLAAALMMTIFAAGIGASVLLIAAHDRPFVGDIAVGPGPLLEVMPERTSGRAGG